MQGRGIAYPPPPAQVAPHVGVFGAVLAIDSLPTFGGADPYLTDPPKDRSRLVALVGKEKAAALGRQAHLLQRRVPLGKPWLARCLAVRGLSRAEIARTLHVIDVTVRGWLRADKPREAGRDDVPREPPGQRQRRGRESGPRAIA